MSASAFNKVLAVLRATFDLAVKAGILYANPARGIRRMPPKNKELILPSRERFRAIVGHVRGAPARFASQSADMVSFLAFSGARVGECRAAIWADEDEARNLMRIHGTKTTASDRWIPLFPNLKALLDEMRARRASCPPNAKLFTTRECADALASACAKAGVPRMTHHDLRHLFATRCIEAGVDIPTVSRWLGHVDGGALAMRTYGHLRQDYSQAQAAKVVW
jgi:integrase